MSQHRILNKASLPYLSAGCCQEQTQILAKQGCCFELFRRALELGDDHAWFALQQQFRPLFIHWVLESVTVEVNHYVVEDLLQVALERFWCCLADSERPLAERFSCTGALLKYMKRCIKSACRDWQRREYRQHRLQERLTLLADTPAQRPF